MKYRYREPHEMKDSGVEWLGMIPKEWEVSKLKYLGKINSGEYISNNELKDNAIYPVFGGNGLVGLTNKYNIENEKIIIGRVGAYCGNVRYTKTRIWVTDNALIVTLNKDENYNYLSKLLKSIELNKLNVSTAQPLITGTKVMNYEIPKPIKFDQQKIADFLDKKCEEFDSVIAKKEMLINKLEEAKKSLISEVVTGKVKVIQKENGEYGIIKREAHEMKDSGVEWLGMIPKEWEVKKVKYCFNFFRGLPITKLDLKTEGIACLNYGEIHSKYPFLINSNSNELQKVSEKYLETNRNSLLKYGDFVFADTSEDLKGSGNFTFIEGNGQIFAGYHTITMRCKMSYLKKYLAYLFESTNIRKQIQSKVKGVKVYSITQNILKDIDILISIDEIEIAKFLDKKCSQFDIAIEKQKEIIEKLKLAKQSLISEAVTGKIEVL